MTQDHGAPLVLRYSGPCGEPEPIPNGLRPTARTSGLRVWTSYVFYCRWERRVVGATVRLTPMTRIGKLMFGLLSKFSGIRVSELRSPSWVTIRTMLRKSAAKPTASVRTTQSRFSTSRSATSHSKSGLAERRVSLPLQGSLRAGVHFLSPQAVLKRALYGTTLAPLEPRIYRVTAVRGKDITVQSVSHGVITTRKRKTHTTSALTKNPSAPIAAERVKRIRVKLQPVLLSHGSLACVRMCYTQGLGFAEEVRRMLHGDAKRTGWTK